LISLSYPDQINYKEKKLTEALHNHPGIEFLPTVTSDETRFRHKAKFTVTGSVEKPIIGLVGEETLDEGREILDCPLHTLGINELAHQLVPLIKSANLTPYSIAQRRGELKGIIIFSSNENEFYLRFILRSKESLDRIKKKLPQLQSSFPKLKVVTANIQSIPHAVLEGSEEIYLTEVEYIKHQLDRFHFRIGPKGFVQTNQEIALKLYSQAANWAHQLKVNNFIELFSGQGAFSFFIQAHVKEAIGIEIDPEAVKAAQLSVQDAGLQHLRFIAQDASKLKDDIKKLSPELLLINPPRRGLAEALTIVLNSETKYLIYSSCSLESFAKDLKQLNQRFELKKIQLFDMFPHTQHFETLALFYLRR
jgi:23S rRNA (uracil747-C5)-methyltransferase